MAVSFSLFFVFILNSRNLFRSVRVQVSIVVYVAEEIETVCQTVRYVEWKSYYGPVFLVSVFLDDLS